MRCHHVLVDVGELLEKHDVVALKLARVDGHLHVDGAVGLIGRELGGADEREPVGAADGTSRELVHERREHAVRVAGGEPGVGHRVDELHALADRALVGARGGVARLGRDVEIARIVPFGQKIGLCLGVVKGTAALPAFSENAERASSSIAGLLDVCARSRIPK